MDSFGPSITRIERIVNDIEDQVYTTRKDDMQAFLHEIEEVRKRVSGLIRLLSGKTSVLLGFEKHHCEDISPDEEMAPGHDLKLYVNDVQDHLATLLSSLRQFESLLSRSQENYVAGLKIDNIRSRQRLNRLMATATVITMIMSFINIICGLFSTNVNAAVPLYANDTPAWYIIIGSEIVLSMALLWLAKRFKWF